MKRIIITENGIFSRLRIGRGSAEDIVIVGAPRGLQEITVHVGIPSSGYFFTVAATQSGDNSWTARCGSLVFATQGSAEYHVTGKDERDNGVWLGSGKLEICPSVLHNAASATPANGDDVYVRNPATGLWHLVTASTVDGEIVLSYSSTGVTR